ncbi:lmo0937 family membrane protein [Ornithinibacillus sp. 4-3]|uniref:Lmo0937 family membrane protein n=1 Tax=Ornithinibacillus sp. 4-3 TaxID=3231488 RepID=A0AB39HQQ8_9BACI
MLWTLFVILLILWILGFSFKILGGFVHILLVIALIVLIIRLVTGRNPAP